MTFTNSTSSLPPPLLKLPPLLPSPTTPHPLSPQPFLPPFIRRCLPFSPPMSASLAKPAANAHAPLPATGPPAFSSLRLSPPPPLIIISILIQTPNFWKRHRLSDGNRQRLRAGNASIAHQKRPHNGEPAQWAQKHYAMHVEFGTNRVDSYQNTDPLRAPLLCPRSIRIPTVRFWSSDD